MRPTTTTELQEIVKTGSQLLPRGGGSKPALSVPGGTVVPIDMTGLSGLLEYEPGEYTFTAYAGTAVRDIQRELAKNGQYLPFDPLLAARGATLGGTIAANSSGSGRYRYGGVRDFILGVRFVDGYGRLIRGGGKVVKNAAGFDLPKFMVGSLGGFGILAEVSFKVFPAPPAYTTLRLALADVAAAMEAIFSLATRPLEMDALDIFTTNSDVDLLIRLGGLPDALPARAERLRQLLAAHSTAIETITDEADEAALWQAANDLAWSAAAPLLVKVPIAPKRVVELDTAVTPHTTHRRYTAGGNVAWLAAPDAAPLDAVLRKLGLAGLALRGTVVRPYLGQQPPSALLHRAAQALDPKGKFYRP
ncbi:MAG: FAD-binding protein [Chloroflexi bacterium]|nr:FAD-binding protein [Ardenticatenaceae bacterium]MBL1131349.1 FAD-binding protein [Chloroflexota bacterium]NOG37451.1 FAD-binding protein [Chloroflexota bacterium]